MKKENSFNSKSSIEDILNDMSQQKNLFQIKQIESKILTEKTFLENQKINKEIKKRELFRKPEICNKCNQNKKLKFCVFCGFYYCSKCFAKKRKSQIEPFQFFICCLLCEEIFLKIYLFKDFNQQRDKLYKEIDINQQIKEEMLKIHQQKSEELQIDEEKFLKEKEQLCEQQNSIKQQEEKLRKLIQKNQQQKKSKDNSVKQEQAQILLLEEQLQDLQEKYELQQKKSQKILLENLNDDSEKIKIQIKDQIKKIYSTKGIKSDIGISIRQRTITEDKKKLLFQSQVKVKKNHFVEKPQTCKCNIF